MAARGNRGGKRQGTVGKAYANRTDLAQNYAPPQGLTTAAIGGLDPNPAPPRPIMGQGPPAPGPPPTPGPMGGQAPLHPDQVSPLDAPTDRPLEPVTTGIGDPALGVGAQWASTTDVVRAAAANPNASPALRAMASRLGIGGY